MKDWGGYDFILAFPSFNFPHPNSERLLSNEIGVMWKWNLIENNKKQNAEKIINRREGEKTETGSRTGSASRRKRNRIR